MGNKNIYEALGRESVHPFPARMAPSIALEVVKRANRPLRVLDPMMGSGTVLALARANGHKAIGIDMDPLAVLISKVWTKAIDKAETKESGIKVLKSAQEYSTQLTVETSYPGHADEETKEFISYWFDVTARAQLTALSHAILELKDKSIADVLWCTLSRLIITKSSGASLAMDLSHSRPHKVFTKAPVLPFDKFLQALDRVLAGCVSNKDKNRGPASVAKEGDARRLSVPSNSIDIVLTSPPYLNAIDYIRCSKFSLVWMGYNMSELRTVRTDSIGSERASKTKDNTSHAKYILNKMALRPRLSDRNEAILNRYIEDMRNSVEEVARVLRPTGKAVYVLGENTIKGTYVRNSVIVQVVAESCGLTLQKRQTRALPANRRYLPPPTLGKGEKQMDSRMRHEIILSFVK